MLAFLPEERWCCVSGFWLETSYDFDGGALVERLITHPYRGCIPLGVHVRKNFDEELRQSAEML